MVFKFLLQFACKTNRCIQSPRRRKSYTNIWQDSNVYSLQIPTPYSTSLLVSFWLVVLLELFLHIYMYIYAAWTTQTYLHPLLARLRGMYQLIGWNGLSQIFFPRAGFELLSSGPLLSKQLELQVWTTPRRFTILPPPPPLPPTPPPPSPPTPSIPGRNYFSLISNFVVERV
jgi:hypothetical protein